MWLSELKEYLSELGFVDNSSSKAGRRWEWGGRNRIPLKLLVKYEGLSTELVVLYAGSEWSYNLDGMALMDLDGLCGIILTTMGYNRTVYSGDMAREEFSNRANELLKRVDRDKRISEIINQDSER